MHTVANDHVPQDVAYGQGLAKKWNCPVQVSGRELSDPGDGFLVNAVVPGCECLHLARALDVRWLHIHRELALLDPETHVSIAFGQMPGKLTEGAPTRIRAEVVLGCRERSQQLQRILSFAIPGVEEPLQFIDRHCDASSDVPQNGHPTESTF